MDSDEEFISYGTPLPDLEEDEVLRKRSVQDLQVRDEKGRQRFHGAFTGGFSAGYFNSVGTKEGWAPATFISTRDRSKSTIIEQNPEDFMDEEDFNEFGIAPKRIHTTSNFQGETSSFGRKRKFISNSDAAIPGEPPLKDIIKPVVESIGISILRRMGWRQGQGIGPRVKKRKDDEIKIYSCSLGPRQFQDKDPMLNRFTLAPEDTIAISYIPKDDYHGIGYFGLSTVSILSDPSDKLSVSSTKSFITKDKKKLAISGQAFGVGAFEDDDDDIYTRDDMTQYDFSEYSASKEEKFDFNFTGTILKNNSSYGLSVLEGFYLATRPKTTKKQYLPPQLPLDFTPMYKRASRFSDANTNKEKSGHKLTADERSKLLGENKFARIGDNTENIVATSSKLTEAHKEVSGPSSKSLHSSSFKPFVKDEPKQKRYEEYLKLRNNQEHFKLIQPSSMTEWEKQQEIEEFSESASLFRPLSKMLSSRFESRSHLGIEHDVMRELQDLKKEKEPVSSLSDINVPIQPKHETFEWHPVPLLCRRFNVPNPYPESTCQGVPHAQKTKSSIFDCLSIGEEILKDNIPDVPETSDVNPSPVKTEIAIETKQRTVEKAATPGSDITTKTEAVSKESGKPPMDLFKDIFQNTSSEESDDSDKPKPNNFVSSLSPKLQFAIKQDVVELRDENQTSTSLDAIKTSRSSNKGAFGVFANLDLDALNKRTPIGKKMSYETSKEIQMQLVCNASIRRSGREISVGADETCSTLPFPADDYYGPELPPALEVLQVASPQKTHKDHKHSKHKHKSKHRKHKKKKKKKRSKNTLDESSNDSFDSDEEISSALILEKLKKLQNKKRSAK